MQSLERLKPLALLFLRAALGVIYISHGYPKLYGHPKDMMPFFEHAGLPGSFVYLAGVIEFFGGAILIPGLFTRIAALLIAIEMGVALWKVHLPLGPISVTKNYEFPLTLCAAAFTLATVGAGMISVDHLIFGGRRKAPRKAKAIE